MSNNDELERERFEAWMGAKTGLDPKLIKDARQDDPDEPYFKDEYDEDALMLICISWYAWQARSSQEEA